MRTKIIEAIAHLDIENWKDTKMVRETIFFKLFGERELLPKVKPYGGTYFSPTAYRGRLIDGVAHNQTIFCVAYNRFYPMIAKELFNDVELIKGYTIGQFVDDLHEMRKETKRMASLAIIERMRCHTKENADIVEHYQLQIKRLKIVQNIMFAIFAAYDFGADMNEVQRRAREIVKSDCKKIVDRGGHILCVNIDTIVFTDYNIPALTYPTHNDILPRVFINGTGSFIEVSTAANIAFIPKVTTSRVIANADEQTFAYLNAK